MAKGVNQYNKLLYDLCTPEQWNEYRTYRCITVTKTSWVRYVIYSDGRRVLKQYRQGGAWYSVNSYCIVQSHKEIWYGDAERVTNDDLVAAKKLLIEYAEDAFLKTAL